MAGSLGVLNLDLVARIGGFEQPLAKASKTASREMGNITNSVKMATTAIAGAGTAAAAAAAGVVAFTNNAAQSARELKNMATLANSSTAEFQRMAYASQTVGVENDKLADILKDVNDRVGDFLSTGGGEMADFFEKIAPRIGMTAEQFRNLSGPQALQKFYDGLQKANLSQAEMTFYMESMADEATALIPLLRNGGSGFAEMAAEADKLGIVLTELDIAKLDEFAGQFDRLSGIFSSMSQILASELAPYLSVIADELVDAAGGADGLRESLPNAIHESVAALGPFLDGLQMARTAIAALQAASGSIAQGYSFAFLTIQENATKMLDFVAGGINEIISGFNNLPGLEVALIDSFNSSGYMQSLRDGYEEVAAFAKKQRNDVADLWNQPMPSEWVDASLDKVQQKTLEIRKTLGTDSSDREGGIISAPFIAGGQAANDAAKELAEFESSAQSLTDTLYPLIASQREYAEQREMIQRIAREMPGLIGDEGDALERLQATYENAGYWADEYELKATSATSNVRDEADAMGVLWENTLERMDDAAVDMWKSFLDGSEDAFGSFKNLALSTLAEIIHAYTTQQITASLGLNIGGGGTQASGTGSSFDLGDLSSIGSSLWDGGFDTATRAYNAFIGTGSTYGGTFGSELVATGNGGFLSASNSLSSSLGSGLSTVGGGLIGSTAGNAIFGESEYGSTLSTLGAFAGSFIPGIGTLAGSALGSFIGSGLGSLFGSSREPFAKTWTGQQNADPMNFYRDYYAYTDLGTVGILDKQKMDPEPLVQWVEGIEQMDNALASMLDDSQLEAVRDELADPSKYKGTDLSSVTEDRYDRAIDAIIDSSSDMVGELVSRVGDIQADNIEDQANELAAALQLGSIIDSSSGVVKDYATQVADDLSMSLTDALGDVQASVANYALVSDAAESLNLQFDALADGAIEASNALVEAAGGLETLQSLQSSYYSNFFSESEHAARLQQQLTDQFEALNMTLPASRDEFRAIVEGLDLATDSGRETYVSMLELSDSFAQLTSDANSAAAGLSEAAKSLYSGGSLDAIGNALDAYNLQTEASQERLEQLEAEKQAIETLSDLMDSLLLSDQSILDPMERLQEAQRQFAELQVRAENGDTDAVSQFQGASSSYLDAAAAYYGQGSSQYAAIFGEVTDSVSGLEDQFSTSLDGITDGNSIADQQLAEQQRARQTLIDQLQTQIGMLNGIDTFSELLDTLPASIAEQLEGIIATQGKYGTVLPDGTYTDDSGFSSTQKTINDLYEDVLGRNADESGLDYWVGELASGRMDLDEIRDRMEDQAAHGYHASGLWSVPHDGYRAVLHEGEAVLPARSGIADEFRAMASGRGNSEMVRELQALRQEVAMLRSENSQIGGQAAQQRSQQIREQQRISKHTKTKVATV